MNRSVKLIAVAALVLAAGQAMAVDDNVDVKVTGQIVPPACVPAISGGAVFDYGSIKAASLAQDDYTVLSGKSLSFTVKCDAPMKIAFKTTDIRKDSGFLGPAGIKLLGADSKDKQLSGLGMINGISIGGYVLGLAGTSYLADGSSVSAIYSTDNGSTWKVGGGWLLDDNKLNSVASSDDMTAPIPLTTLSAYISAQAILNKGSELDLTKVINLDGMSTIQVIYL
ncbi:DUF1120 domain-containing protein [Scandinavium sp.]|uniref:DUF1120 domain-containing protein n=1 Tax=Scandinavium sp. TaxID=2830653 RepID=UPI00289D06FA|nr:DUF1120 domain-containing protein [Scandinavium sp.]